jgi:hypothetical protein
MLHLRGVQRRCSIHILNGRVRTPEKIDLRRPTGISGNPKLGRRQCDRIKLTHHVVGNPAKIFWRQAVHISTNDSWPQKVYKLCI